MDRTKARIGYASSQSDREADCHRDAMRRHLYAARAAATVAKLGPDRRYVEDASAASDCAISSTRDAVAAAKLRQEAEIAAGLIEWPTDKDAYLLGCIEGRAVLTEALPDHTNHLRLAELHATAMVAAEARFDAAMVDMSAMGS